MKINKKLNGHDLLSDDLFITRDGYVSPKEIVVTSRIGVAYAGEWASKPLRFYIQGNKFVSRK